MHASLWTRLCSPLLPLALTMAVAGCEADSGAAEAGQTRGPLGKADKNEGSCAGEQADFCGGQSDGACFCDAECSEFGDCCHDVSAVCEAEDPAGAAVLIEQGLHFPESVVFDEESQTYFVSNLGHDILQTDPLHPPEGKVGSISRHRPDGSLLDEAWASGFVSPKGLTVSGGVLYVADPQEIVALAIEDGSEVARYTHAEVGLFNDVAPGPDGMIYATDTANPGIYRIDPYDDDPASAVEVVARDKSIEFLNGLTVVDGTIYAGSTGLFPDENGPGTPGRLYAIDPDRGEIREIPGVQGRWDGVADVGGGQIALNDFVTGDVHLVDPTSGQSMKLLDSPIQPDPATGGLAGLADMGVTGSTLLIPSMFTHQIFAFTPPSGG